MQILSLSPHGPRSDHYSLPMLPPEGRVVVFHKRSCGGFKPGEQWEVSRRDHDGTVIVQRHGQEKPLDLDTAQNFETGKGLHKALLAHMPIGSPGKLLPSRLPTGLGHARESEISAIGQNRSEESLPIFWATPGHPPLILQWA
jgi:hypothetical protein